MTTDNKAVDALMARIRPLKFCPTVDALNAEMASIRAAITAALAAERERSMIALREWAVLRWRDEVQNRPLVNKNRRPLDDTWRQVMRYAGLDPDEAVGPSHDVIRAQEPTA